MIRTLASFTGLIFSTAVSAAGTSVAVSTGSTWAWLIPVFCGCCGALIVRGVTVTTPTKKKKVWRFEALVTALVILVTAVVVEEKAMTPMYATFAGIGFGAFGVGIIGVARTAAVTILTNLAKTFLSLTPTADDQKP
jgi:hypothetical protein